MEQRLTTPLLLVLLCLVPRPYPVLSVSDTGTGATPDEADGKVSTRIDLRFTNTYSKVEEPHAEAFKYLIETCFHDELPRIQSLSSSLDTSSIRHVRARILEQWWGEEYHIRSSSRGLSGGPSLQPLIVRLLITGRSSKPPASADFYSAIRAYFDSGGGDILVDEYIKRVQTIFPRSASFLSEVEEVELIEQHGIVIKEQTNAGKQMNLPGLTAGCALAAVALLCVAGYIYIRQKKRQRPIIAKREPERSSSFLPSEIDLESVGGSVVSNMYASSFVKRQPEKNLLPTPLSDNTSDLDRTFLIDDHSTDAEGSRGSKGRSDDMIEATTSSPADSIVYKDDSNTDVEKQAQPQLTQYLSKYNPDEASVLEGRSSSVAGVSVSANGVANFTGSDCRESNDGSSVLTCEEASLLANLGMDGECIDDVQVGSHGSEEEILSFASSDKESKGSTSEGNPSKSISSVSRDDFPINLEKDEADLLKNLGVAGMSGSDDEGREEDISSASNASVSTTSPISTTRSTCEEETSQSRSSRAETPDEDSLLASKEEGTGFSSESSMSSANICSTPRSKEEEVTMDSLSSLETSDALPLPLEITDTVENSNAGSISVSNGVN
mmetsp:Transcript_26152/g.56647  ORF Transcript_26152/g.56647 Transcript_26152/m.56647 type:complete len:610 (+) Transcript_26152:109-1938(+)|eukprot:CAMPEP_0178579970 /NCGR_PEP_ID=MMETSP0697-20121206/22371_1 /TAXON_ID=265572 /ORGANISM="Extubocellulus spinifer, Strain CCMP396" /LENGTH=609 /DNA_ID=CAMNT_0020215463 /DNA_START=31 /DNA_END=1860 /DNA_ORIENTATION=+